MLGTRLCRNTSFEVSFNHHCMYTIDASRAVTEEKRLWKEFWDFLFGTIVADVY